MKNRDLAERLLIALVGRTGEALTALETAQHQARLVQLAVDISERFEQTTADRTATGADKADDIIRRYAGKK